ncbi:hypothetical protein [Flavobacterium sp. 1355]|uniref:hypothetical protein n=1 Tax=Flavobacterium sp. 1355 TaxID=2806571 RepID=UPI001AE29903|nr:hypothetical protein [Flavobacterium sp. 1355]MBP1225760.1 putative membrane protein [Flavobacterium sp. 1355]
MNNSVQKSNSGKTLSVLSLVLSFFALISAGICCLTFFITLLIAIPFGILTIFLSFLAVISGTIGMSQARKSNSSLLISQIGLCLGIIAVSIIVIFVLVMFYSMQSTMLK